MNHANTFQPPVVLVKALETKHISQVSCGQQHAIAMDNEGFVYVWGFNGYCRLGLGDQKDVLAPKAVPHVSFIKFLHFLYETDDLLPQFANSNELMRAYLVSAGPTNSVVIDRQRMYWMAGKVCCRFFCLYELL